jgi:hypothetical protein
MDVADVPVEWWSVVVRRGRRAGGFVGRALASLVQGPGSKSPAYAEYSHRATLHECTGAGLVLCTIAHAHHLSTALGGFGPGRRDTDNFLMCAILNSPRSGLRINVDAGYRGEGRERALYGRAIPAQAARSD